MARQEAKRDAAADAEGAPSAKQHRVAAPAPLEPSVTGTAEQWDAGEAEAVEGGDDSSSDSSAQSEAAAGAAGAEEASEGDVGMQADGAGQEVDLGDILDTQDSVEDAGVEASQLTEVDGEGAAAASSSSSSSSESEGENAAEADAAQQLAAPGTAEGPSGDAELAAAIAAAEEAAALSSSSSDDEEEELPTASSLLLAQTLAPPEAADHGADRTADDATFFSLFDEGDNEEVADIDAPGHAAVEAGEAAIQEVLLSSSSSSDSEDDDATEAMELEEDKEDGISDNSSLLALLGAAAGGPGAQAPAKATTSLMEQALLKDVLSKAAGADRLAHAEQLGRWLKTKVGSFLKGAPGSGDSSEPSPLLLDDAKAMAIRLAEAAGGSESQTRLAWGKWPGAPDAAEVRAAALKALEAETHYGEDDEWGFYEPQHREMPVAGRSNLRRRTAKKSGAGYSISIPKKKKQLRDTYMITSFRHLDLWFACAGAEVVCDWCLCTSSQVGGRLQGEPSRSQFSQWEFVCQVCQRAFDQN